MRTRGKIREYGFFYLAGILAAFWFKYSFGYAKSDELLWILTPVTRWVACLSGLSFVSDQNAGYVCHSARLVIAPSCSGLRFLIISMELLLFAFVHRTGSRRKSAVWTLFCFAVSYGYTILVNGIRIAAAVYLPDRLERMGIRLEWLTPGRLHTVIGAAVYFTALLILYRTWDGIFGRLQRKSNEISAAGKTHGRAAGNYRHRNLLPACWYLFFVLGIPFFGRVLKKDCRGYPEYAVITVGVCLGVLTAAESGRRLLRALGAALHPQAFRTPGAGGSSFQTPLALNERTQRY